MANCHTNVEGHAGYWQARACCSCFFSIEAVVYFCRPGSSSWRGRAKTLVTQCCLGLRRHLLARSWPRSAMCLMLSVMHQSAFGRGSEDFPPNLLLRPTAGLQPSPPPPRPLFRGQWIAAPQVVLAIPEYPIQMLSSLRFVFAIVAAHSLSECPHAARPGPLGCSLTLLRPARARCVGNFIHINAAETRNMVPLCRLCSLSCPCPPSYYSAVVERKRQRHNS